MSVSLRRQRLPMFQQKAKEALDNAQLRRNLGKATGTIRNKRAQVVAEVPDWEELREAGRAVKERVLRNLDTYLLQLEASVQRVGGHVHWARDAQEANAIIADIAHQHDAREIVKVKSLTTDEIHLNQALEQSGITAYETDLAELILQLSHDKSSHILVPAIHRNRAEIYDIFKQNLHDIDIELSDEPSTLTAAARQHLRQIFLRAPMAVSGVNLAVAETGTIYIAESEGNGRMCLTLPPVLVSVMGMEKLVPSWQDMEIFLQLLPRSSTGERMNPYNSLWTGVTEGNGPQEFHLVILDNGRSRVLADEVGRQSLYCIRCSACMNVCPVYERTGGHAYSSVYPGPIGAILTPQLLGITMAESLPYASTLCGACYDACPVKINIPEVLVHLRGEVVREHQQHKVWSRLNPENVAMNSLAYAFTDATRYEHLQHLGRIGQIPLLRKGKISQGPGPLGSWTAMRDLHGIPKQTFREWWRARAQEQEQ
ncbi:iron-sulfur cluster-binding protein [Ktedonobacteria bacterium brp13]|nr:iron-sulfur cluster-binding protein [Ktedonobacteria bacterium brp13]